MFDGGDDMLIFLEAAMMTKSGVISAGQGWSDVRAT